MEQLNNRFIDLQAFGWLCRRASIAMPKSNPPGAVHLFQIYPHAVLLNRPIIAQRSWAVWSFYKLHDPTLFVSARANFVAARSTEFRIVLLFQ
jgi:hypothetical protein